MRNEKIVLFINILVLILAIIGVILSYLNKSSFFLYISIILIVVSIISILLLQSALIFIKDKELNIEELKKSGLTIVECQSCKKVNVLEDQYCIYCGEKLGDHNEQL